jgi:hypothetical protein
VAWANSGAGWNEFVWIFGLCATSRLHPRPTTRTHQKTSNAFNLNPREREGGTMLWRLRHRLKFICSLQGKYSSTHTCVFYVCVCASLACNLISFTICTCCALLSEHKNKNDPPHAPHTWITCLVRKQTSWAFWCASGTVLIFGKQELVTLKQHQWVVISRYFIPYLSEYEGNSRKINNAIIIKSGKYRPCLIFLLPQNTLLLFLTFKFVIFYWLRLYVNLISWSYVSKWTAKLY